MTHFDFWQFWRNIPDTDVARFMKLFSDHSIEGIEAIESLKNDGHFDVNATKKAFATEVTAMVRGQDAANGALWSAEDAFEKKTDMKLPVHSVDSSIFNGKTLSAFLRDEGFIKSAGEAKRMIQQGGIRINDVKIEDDGTLVQRVWGDFKLSIGQKKHFRIIIK